MISEIVSTFRVMNTDVRAVVCVPKGAHTTGDQALSRVQDLFGRVERVLSRFRPASELSRLNANAGRPFKASPLLLEVVRVALEAARATAGVFDPTVLHYLVAVGYDRSFERLAACGSNPEPSKSTNRYTWQDVYLDEDASTILMPEGCGLDLGGIGKGWTVDQACRDLERFSGCVVNAGGDVGACGSDANGEPWTVAITDPHRAGNSLGMIELCEGAVCSSTTTRRKWQVEGRAVHHLIDPRSGKPADSGVCSATVIADSAVRAEVLAKVALILGPQAGMRLIEEQPMANGPRIALIIDPEFGVRLADSQPGVQGLLVLSDGGVIRSSGFKEVLGVA